ncbi:MAG: hypothetical protein HQM08_05510 [Candidatus Riflebacteria bacterium]|nr:hypothetical protein [Candidatus Riflebacteria bacterium]
MKILVFDAIIRIPLKVSTEQFAMLYKKTIFFQKFICAFLIFLFSQTPLIVFGVDTLPLPPVTAPYKMDGALKRAEELFTANNYREALIFYYESIVGTTDVLLRSKLHFRLAECLEGVKRYEFAEYHYKLALRGNLPPNLAERVMYKLKHLPQLAQHEEAVRLFKKAMDSYKRRDIRNSIDDYLESLRLEPTLMEKDESGLIDDAINYLTYLSEAKDKEPERLLKLAALLELRGETEKAIETLKQILIIYPKSKAADLAEEKLSFFTQKRNQYMEIRRPKEALSEVVPQISPIVVEITHSFNNAESVSKELEEAAYTFKASNEQTNVPNGRFEVFSAVLGKGANQKEFVFTAGEGIPEKVYRFDDGNCVYQLAFDDVNITTAFIQDIFGEAPRPVQLFKQIGLKLTVYRKQ